MASCLLHGTGAMDHARPPRNRSEVLGAPIFKWLLVPASILAVFGFTVFISADIARMRTLRSIAASVFVAACLMAAAAALIGWYERRHP
jgi:hypothetical protein